MVRRRRLTLEYASTAFGLRYDNALGREGQPEDHQRSSAIPGASTLRSRSLTPVQPQQLSRRNLKDVGTFMIISIIT